MSTISARVACQTLPAQLDRVEAGEEVAITRHGRVIAVLVRPDVLRARRASEAWELADTIGDMMEKARREPVGQALLTRGRADELVEDVRSSRSAR